MNGLKISKMQVINNPKEDAKIPIVQNGTNYSMQFGTLNKLITQIYEDQDIPNALQQLQIQIDSADAATAKAKDTAAHPGYVDNDGYYYKWNVETKTYEKTDVNLKGEKGDTFTFDDLTDEQVSVLMAPAIDAAAKAQDTADGKRRVFTSQPTIASIYDIGDVWVNATYGTYKNDFLVCITAKAAGAAFDIAHWQVASKYTDDTAAQDVKKYIDNNIIVPCGNWEPGTSYLKNRLVTFNNQTFISTTDTSDCPIVVLANENGDYLVDDGNYITPTDENGNITYNHSWKAYSSSEALEQDFAKFKKETSATLKILNDKINSILIRVNKLLG